MHIITTTGLTTYQKTAIFRLWNSEYPQQLAYSDIAGLERYLGNLTGQEHHLCIDDSETIFGWAFSFDREQERWFAVIVDSTQQRKGIGAAMLTRLKQTASSLNGWVVDHERYQRSDGEQYVSPLGFYIKHGFEVCADTRLEIELLSAVKIRWKR